MQIKPFQLAKVSGIPLMVDYTWLPVVVLHFSLVAIFYFPDQIGNISLTAAFLYGAILTVLMFGSVIVHELAHALTAKLERIQTLEIRLHVFGGYARLASDPPNALAELRIAIAGPVASFLLAIFAMTCLLIGQAVTSGQTALALRSMFFYLFIGNLALAMFNLIPGLPLDGGRVLRAYLWHRNKDIVAATQVAKKAGVALAYMLASYGIYRLFWWRDPFTSIWMIVLAFMLKRSAEEDYRYRVLQAQDNRRQTKAITFPAGTVGAIMRPHLVAVAPDLSIQSFIKNILTQNRYTHFPVTHNGRLYGVLALDKLRAIPESEWEHKTLREVMHPVEDSVFITAQASIEHAARKIAASPLGSLAVIDHDGFVIGYLSRAEMEQKI